MREREEHAKATDAARFEFLDNAYSEARQQARSANKPIEEVLPRALVLHLRIHPFTVEECEKILATWKKDGYVKLGRVTWGMPK